MSTFVVHCTGTGRRDTYDDSEFFWTVDYGGTLVIHKRGNISTKVAAYAPQWWYRVETEDDDG